MAAVWAVLADRATATWSNFRFRQVFYTHFVYIRITDFNFLHIIFQ